jgi:hypothetical protein
VGRTFTLDFALGVQGLSEQVDVQRIADRMLVHEGQCQRRSPSEVARALHEMHLSGCLERASKLT